MLSHMHTSCLYTHTCARSHLHAHMHACIYVHAQTSYTNNVSGDKLYHAPAAAQRNSHAKCQKLPDCMVGLHGTPLGGQRAGTSCFESVDKYIPHECVCGGRGVTLLHGSENPLCSLTYVCAREHARARVCLCVCICMCGACVP